MSGNCRNIVAGASGGGFATVKVLVEDILVRDGASKFQIRISDGAVWVGGRDESSLNVLGGRGMPKNGLKAGVGHSGKPYPPMPNDCHCALHKLRSSSRA
jgi:hypothetical protein